MKSLKGIFFYFLLQKSGKERRKMTEMMGKNEKRNKNENRRRCKE